MRVLARDGRTDIPPALKHVLDAFDAADETAVCPPFERFCPTMDQPASVRPHERFRRFADFYPFYLSEHRDPTCRRLHVIGTAAVVIVLAGALVTRNPWFLLAAPVAGYGFAWIGHFVFEKNRPATFQYPWYSLLGDFALFRDVLTGRIKF